MGYVDHSGLQQVNHPPSEARNTGADDLKITAEIPECTEVRCVIITKYSKVTSGEA